MSADRAAAKQYAQTDHFGPDHCPECNLAAAYLELLAEYKDEQTRWENVFDAQTLELVTLRARLAEVEQATIERCARMWLSAEICETARRRS